MGPRSKGCRKLQDFVKQPQPSETPVVAVSKPPNSAPCPPMQASRDNFGGQSLQNKASGEKVQCFKCRELGHFAKDCPQKRQAVTPDSIPEATLIATITPAAGRRNNRRILSQLCAHRSMDLPVPPETSVQQSVSWLLPSSSFGKPPQKKPYRVSGVTCFSCRKEGHFASECPLKKASPPEPPQILGVSVS